MENYRINTNIGKDQNLIVELNQDYDLLEILSLKFTQKEIYTSICSDYGVVCGRVSTNNGFGIPSANVSIFIPLSEDDEDDPVITSLYPYKSVSDTNEDGYRYNLLPHIKQHGGHEPTGTFPDQLDILSREEYLIVFEKYYKYTVKTNDAGDFMIWGVPIGTHTLHIDIDLSNIGCFSLRPDDFLRKGFGVDDFKSMYEFKSSTNIESLPQIKTFNKTVEVYPFWGNVDLCQIGITRTDFDLSEQGIKLEPKALLIGGTYTDSGKMSVNKNCEPRKGMGRKCDLMTRPGNIEFIRFTPYYDDNNRPILEYLDIKEDFGEDGSFLTSIPMNMDYVITNELGENEYTNNPNKGIPTSGCYRIRINLNNDDLDRTRTVGSYLVPNIREFTSDLNRSYAFSLNYDDYPVRAIDDLILNTNEDGFYVPQDYFFRFTYNKVYTVSSFQESYVHNGNSRRYLGIKDILPNEENDCSGTVVTPPVNFGTKNENFQLLMSNITLFIEHLNNLVTLTFFNIIVKIFHGLADIVSLRKEGSPKIHQFAYKIQENSQRKLYLITYPECEECGGDDETESVQTGGLPNLFCEVGTLTWMGGGNILPSYNTTLEEGCEDVILIPNPTYMVDNIDNYYFEYEGQELFFNETNKFWLGVSLFGGLFYTDENGIFNNPGQIIKIYSRLTYMEPENYDIQSESGCGIYDTPYNEKLIKIYNCHVGDIITGLTRDQYISLGNPPIVSTIISDEQDKLELTCEEEQYTRISNSGQSEFQNGVFSIVPGTQSNRRLFDILKEYRKRKRVGTLFCGGIVNFSFIENWLSGSLYFFQFKSKEKEKKDYNKMKFCKDLIHYSEIDNKFYYKVTQYDPNSEAWGKTITNYNQIKLGRPTTFVDLGPRDEFIKEICIDKTLDSNCSVSRSIGASSYQNFGELIAMGINYRMDVSNNDFYVNNFFDNRGFESGGFSKLKVFDGDLLQLISINNEVGIEEFDLQNPKYSGYNYSDLDPELYPEFFKKDGNYGPLPITLLLDEDGAKIRSCLNEPGRLTESSQNIPFHLWDKKGYGFGGSNSNILDDQSWDFSGVTVLPLQGMSFGFKYSDHEYLLLPITNTFSGLTKSIEGSTVIPEFDVMETTDNHDIYGGQYPGFTYLYITDGDELSPIAGTLYTRYGSEDTWDEKEWGITNNFIIPRSEDYYETHKQILSTPFSFYFGLRPGKTGVDKLIEKYGPKNAFSVTNDEFTLIPDSTCLPPQLLSVKYLYSTNFLVTVSFIEQSCSNLIIQFSQTPYLASGDIYGTTVSCTSDYHMVSVPEVNGSPWWFRVKQTCGDGNESDWVRSLGISDTITPTPSPSSAPFVTPYPTPTPSYVPYCSPINVYSVTRDGNYLNIESDSPVNCSGTVIQYKRIESSTWTTDNMYCGGGQLEIDLIPGKTWVFRVMQHCDNGGSSQFGEIFTFTDGI